MASLRALGGKCRALMAPLKTPSSSSSSTSNTAAAAAAAKPKKSSGGGAAKPSPVSPTLSKFIGAPEISRTEAVKKVWDHIKLHNLQNPTNRREIICDEKLKTLFSGKDRVGMLEIAKLLSQHFVKTG